MLLVNQAATSSDGTAPQLDQLPWLLDELGGHSKCWRTHVIFSQIAEYISRSE